MEARLDGPSEEFYFKGLKQFGSKVPRNSMQIEHCGNSAEK